MKDQRLQRFTQQVYDRLLSLLLIFLVLLLVAVLLVTLPFESLRV